MSGSPSFTGELVYNDAAHTYMLDGVRCKSVTAVAKISIETYAIDLYQKRMVAMGMMLQPDLIEQVAAAPPDNRIVLDQICVDAAEAANAHLKANRGSQMHRATEFVDLGRDDRLLTDQQKRDAAAWRRTLDAYGIVPLDGFVEGFVCWPEYNVAGRFDRVAVIGVCGGVTAILDLKSGENAVTYPQSTAAQLALYANAPHVSKTVRTIGDRSTVTEWQTMPATLDRQWGYVVYLPPDADVGELWRINLEHGRTGADLALQLVDWRKAHNYGRGLSQKVAAPVSTTVEPSSVGGDGVKNAHPAPPADRRKQLLARFMDLSEADQARFRALGIDRNDLDAIEQALDRLDPFAQQQATTTTAARGSASAAACLPTPDDEGGPATGFEALEGRFSHLDDDGKEWVWSVITEASQAGVPFIANKSTGKRTVRRFELYRGLILLAEAGLGGGDDDLVRGLVATVLDSDAPYHPVFTLGHCVGSLDVEQAKRFAMGCGVAALKPEELELRDRPVTV